MDVSPVDRGDFICIASNAYGQDRATIQLIVQGICIFNKAYVFVIHVWNLMLLYPLLTYMLL